MKEIIIDGVEYTLTPKVKEEFTYPIWFKNTIGTICRFDKLNYATCVDSIEESTWYIGEVNSNCTPHTNKDIWTQVSEPKKTKIVYEWLTQFDETSTPCIVDVVLTEQDAKKRFKNHLWYKKSGREFEVEV